MDVEKDNDDKDVIYEIFPHMRFSTMYVWLAANTIPIYK